MNDGKLINGFWFSTKKPSPGKLSPAEIAENAHALGDAAEFKRAALQFGVEDFTESDDGLYPVKGESPMTYATRLRDQHNQKETAERLRKEKQEADVAALDARLKAEMERQKNKPRCASCQIELPLVSKYFCDECEQPLCNSHAMSSLNPEYPGKILCSGCYLKRKEFDAKIKAGKAAFGLPEEGIPSEEEAAANMKNFEHFSDAQDPDSALMDSIKYFREIITAAGKGRETEVSGCPRAAYLGGVIDTLEAVIPLLLKSDSEKIIELRKQVGK